VRSCLDASWFAEKICNLLPADELCIGANDGMADRLEAKGMSLCSNTEVRTGLSGLLVSLAMASLLLSCAAQAGVTGKSEGTSSFGLPSLAPFIKDAREQADPIVSELDAAIRTNPGAAFSAERCDELESIVRSALAQDPRSITATYLQQVCQLSSASLIERGAASRELLLKIASYEQAPGLYFGDRVIEVSTMFDPAAYALATDSEMLDQYFDVAGGGRRIYYVAVLRNIASGRQETVHFDMTALSTRALRKVVDKVDANSTEVLEYSPGALMLSILAQMPEPSAQAQVGWARFLADIPGNSLRTASVRALLERAADAGNPQGQIVLARSLLREEAGAESHAKAFALARAASASEAADADLLLAAMHLKGIGTARDTKAASHAFARAVAVIDAGPAAEKLAVLFREVGSALYDVKLGKRYLMMAARAGNARAQNDLGFDCQQHSDEAGLKRCNRWYEKSSADGLGVATLNLAINYESGRGIERDISKARSLCERAISEGNLAAASNLGLLIEREDGARADLAHVASLYRRAAEWGDPWGQNNYAVTLRDGSGVTIDLAASAKWFELSAAQGNPNAVIGLAEAHEYGRGMAPDQEEAARLYGDAAAKGNITAMLRLASMTREGRGTRKDAGAWRSLLVRAAELGNAEAMWQLGEEYLHGGIVEVDRVAGFDWLRRSAETGNDQGMLKLGFALIRDVDDSGHADGIGWLERAALAGSSEASYALGYAYENGIGVEQDYAQGRDWYEKAASTDHARAITALAYMKLEGLGEPKDSAAARALYAKAASLGYEVAACNLGDLVISGLGGEKDVEGGWKRIKDAADAGARMCQLKLGVAYRYGEDPIPRRIDEAKSYLEKASAQDVEEADAQLAEIAMRENQDDDAVQRQGKATLVRLADAGMSRAQFLLAEACLIGRPWPRDFACARKRFEEADATGFAAAAGNIGIFKVAGLGGPVDLDDAEVWYRKAIEQGAYRIKYELGRLLLSRNRDIPQALDLLLADSVIKGSAAAYVIDRYCREHGDCPVDESRRAALRKQIASMTPDDKNRVAWTLAIDALSDAEDGHFAVKLLRTLPAKQLKSWAVLDTLAAAHARAGEFDRAVAVQKDVIAHLPGSVLKREIRMVEERLQLYRDRKTCDLPF
jgi:uncharacterized protein